MNQNIIFTCLTILTFFLCAALPLLENRLKKRPVLLSLNRKLHPVFAILFLIFSFIHGILAGKKPGMLTGKAAWFCILILIVCSLLKKYIPRSRWILIHRILSVFVVLLVVVHIICASVADI